MQNSLDSYFLSTLNIVKVCYKTLTLINIKQMKKIKLLFLAIGNTLLSDEGLGIALLEEIKKQNWHDDFRYLDGGTLSFTLAPDIENCDYLIVLDAAKLNKAPGTLEVFENTQMDTFIAKGNASVHEVGIADLMDIARLTGHLPKKRALIAIQPENMDWGERLSDAVIQAFPHALEKIKKLLEQWGAITA